MTDQRAVLPDCMMPDGAEPCAAFQRLQAERDRLREALERAREMAEDGKTSACAMQVCEDIELMAQEALSHD